MPESCFSSSSAWTKQEVVVRLCDGRAGRFGLVSTRDDLRLAGWLRSKTTWDAILA